MVTLSCLIVIASLFTQGLGNGTRHSSLKLIDIFFFLIIFRLFIVFVIQFLQWRLQRWVHGGGNNQGAEVLPGHNENTGKALIEAACMEETRTTQVEGESHQGNMEGHNKLTAPRKGWTDGAMTNSQPMETKTKVDSSCSIGSSLRISSYNLLTKHTTTIHVAAFCTWVGIDLVTFAIFMQALYTSRAVAWAKFNEYCDTNLEWMAVEFIFTLE